jgi:hypothetical protein
VVDLAGQEDHYLSDGSEGDVSPLGSSRAILRSMPADDRVSLDPLKPTQALKALLSVDVDASADAERCQRTREGNRCALKAGHVGPCRSLPPRKP